MVTGLTDDYNLAVDASGNIYVANFNNSTISKVTPAGTLINATFVNSGLSAAAFLAFDPSGNLYVSDFGNNIYEVPPAAARRQRSSAAV